MRFVAAFTHDVRFQFRHRFYYAYLLLTIIYILTLWYIPSFLKSDVLILILFSDPCGLGFFFVGGMILLEKEQNTYDALFVTPITVHQFLFARICSLALLAISASVVIALFAAGNGQFSLGLLVTAIALSSVCFTLFGITLAVRVRTLNQYLIGSVVYSVLFIPLLQFFGIISHPFLSILPTWPSLQLIRASFGQEPFRIDSLLILLIWTGIAYIWAYKWFRHYILEKLGD